MKKSSKLIMLVALGILIFSFIPVVAAKEVNQRPLDDWLDPNYDVFSWGADNWAFADFVSPYSMLVCKMGLPWPKAGLPWAPGIKYDLVYENGLVEGATIIEGSIKERKYDDGRALITLMLDVKNAPLTVYNYIEFIGYCFNNTDWWPDEGIPPSAILGEGIDGYINYKVICKFFISAPGDPLPIIWDIWYDYISCNIIGTGYGILTEHAAAYGFTPGELGMVKVHQICLFKPDFKETHPKYDPFYGDLWPVETVEIHEIG
ncbi:MAG: hypothetical protein ACFFA2_12055 [Promethearchaeota archaeon]